MLKACCSTFIVPTMVYCIMIGGILVVVEATFLKSFMDFSLTLFCVKQIVERKLDRGAGSSCTSILSQAGTFQMCWKLLEILQFGLVLTTGTQMLGLFLRICGYLGNLL